MGMAPMIIILKKNFLRCCLILFIISFWNYFLFANLMVKGAIPKKNNPEKESEQPQSQETIAKQTPKKRIKRSSKQ